MRQNFGRDKKRIEESKRKKREEKRNKRLAGKTPDISASVLPEVNPETPIV